MNKKYRIVRDRYNGYEAQWSYRWLPIWFQCFCCNSTSTIEKAEEVARKHSTKIVKYLGEL